MTCKVTHILSWHIKQHNGIKGVHQTILNIQRKGEILDIHDDIMKRICTTYVCLYNPQINNVYIEYNCPALAARTYGCPSVYHVLHFCDWKQSYILSFTLWQDIFAQVVANTINSFVHRDKS